MELSKENLEVLKKLTSINSQMYLTSDLLSMASNDKMHICYYDWGVKLTKDFGIYDMNELLQVISLFNEPKIIEGENALTIETEFKNFETTYRYSAKDVIVTPPEKTVLLENKIGETKSKFELSKDNLKLINKQSVILKNDHIEFKDNVMVSNDHHNTSCHVFKMNVQVDNSMPNTIIKADCLNKSIEDDYEVEVTENGIILKAKNNPLMYIIAKLSL